MRISIRARLGTLLALVAGAVVGPVPAGTARAAPVDACAQAEAFDPHRFAHSTVIGNKWFPLRPNTRRTLEGRSVQDGRPSGHREEFVVTGLTKVVDGVRAVVVLDRDYQAGELDEQELTFFAEDAGGAIWNLGEYPEEFENGRFTGAPDTWLAGAVGAQAGLHMPASPAAGGAAYRQGYAPDIDFYDCAKPLRTGRRVCTAQRCYDGALEVDEWSPLDPDSGHQRKFYAPQVGNIKITAVGDPEAETMELTGSAALTPAEAHAADEQARQLDARAFHVAPDSYAGTSPAR